MRILTIALALVALVALAACSSEKSAAPVTTAARTTPTTAGGTVDYGARYTAIMGPANEQFQKFADTLTATKSETAQLVPDGLANDTLTALEKANGELARIDWPADVAAEMRDFRKALAALTADVGAVNGQTIASSSTFGNQFAHDLTAQKAATQAVRAKLGLAES